MIPNINLKRHSTKAMQVKQTHSLYSWVLSVQYSIQHGCTWFVI